MDTLPLVDPDLRDLLKRFALMDLRHFPLEQIREARARKVRSEKSPEFAPRQVIEVPGHEGVSLRVFYPPGGQGPYPVVYDIHGGGFIIGQAEDSDKSSTDMARRFGAVVVSVNYRLAPETVFPGPQEDCYAGLCWLVSNSAALNIDPGRVVIRGLSAGGCLAAALTLMVRDRGELPPPAGQLLLYPMLDYRTGLEGHPDPNPTTGQFVWTRSFNRIGWESLRGHYDMADGQLGYFSPPLAADLSGLPPAFIAVGALDLLMEESVHYALQLSRSAVAVDLHVYPGACHCFEQVESSSLAQQFFQDEHYAFYRMLRAASA